jgi:Asp/Glu/hydantoin racemase
MTRIGLINPNSNAGTTEMMVAIAASTSDVARIVGYTARHSPPLITHPAALLASAPNVVGIGLTLQDHDAIIVSAFGDPGAAELASALTIPVVGIGAAAALAAADRGAPFAVVTTTPDLVGPIDALMNQHRGDVPFLGTFVPPVRDAAALMARTDEMDAALFDQISLAIAAGARQIIIGGGPLGAAAERLGPQSAVPLIHPIKEAVRACLARIGPSDAKGMA